MFRKNFNIFQLYIPHKPAGKNNFVCGTYEQASNCEATIINYKLSAKLGYMHCLPLTVRMPIADCFELLITKIL